MSSLVAERVLMKSIKSAIDWNENCKSRAKWYTKPNEIFEWCGFWYYVCYLDFGRFV